MGRTFEEILNEMYPSVADNDGKDGANTAIPSFVSDYSEEGKHKDIKEDNLAFEQMQKHTGVIAPEEVEKIEAPKTYNEIYEETSKDVLASDLARKGVSVFNFDKMMKESAKSFNMENWQKTKRIADAKASDNVSADDVDSTIKDIFAQSNKNDLVDVEDVLSSLRYKDAEGNTYYGFKGKRLYGDDLARDIVGSYVDERNHRINMGDSAYREQWSQSKYGIPFEEYAKGRAEYLEDKFKPVAEAAEAYYEEQEKIPQMSFDGEPIIDNIALELGKLRTATNAFRDNTFWSGVGAGSVEAIRTATFDFGGVLVSAEQEDALDKYLKGEELNAKERLLVEMAKYSQILAEEKSKYRKGLDAADVGEGLIGSIGFMASLGAQSALGVGKSIGKGLAEQSVKQAFNSKIKEGIKLGVKKTSAWMGNTSARTALSTMPYQDYAQRRLSHFQFTDNGLMKEEVNPFADMYRAYASTFAEIAAEDFGGLLDDGMKAFGVKMADAKFFNKLADSKLATKLAESKLVSKGRELANKAGDKLKDFTPAQAVIGGLKGMKLNSMVGEVAEEYVTAAIQPLVTGEFFSTINEDGLMPAFNKHYADALTSEFALNTFAVCGALSAGGTLAKGVSGAMTAVEITNLRKDTKALLEGISDESLRNTLYTAINSNEADRFAPLAQMKWNSISVDDASAALKVIFNDAKTHAMRGEAMETERLKAFAPFLQGAIGKAYRGIDPANPTPTTVVYEAYALDEAGNATYIGYVTFGDLEDKNAIVLVENNGITRNVPVAGTKFVRTSLSDYISEMYAMMFSTSISKERLNEVIENIRGIAKMDDKAYEKVLEENGFSVYRKGSIVTLADGRQGVVRGNASKGYYEVDVTDVNGNKTTELVGFESILNENDQAMAEAQVEALAEGSTEAPIVLPTTKDGRVSLDGINDGKVLARVLPSQMGSKQKAIEAIDAEIQRLMEEQAKVASKSVGLDAMAEATQRAESTLSRIKVLQDARKALTEEVETPTKQTPVEDTATHTPKEKENIRREREAKMDAMSTFEFSRDYRRRMLNNKSTHNVLRKFISNIVKALSINDEAIAETDKKISDIEAQIGSAYETATSEADIERIAEQTRGLQEKLDGLKADKAEMEAERKVLEHRKAQYEQTLKDMGAEKTIGEDAEFKALVDKASEILGLPIIVSEEAFTDSRQNGQHRVSKKGNAIYINAYSTRTEQSVGILAHEIVHEFKQFLTPEEWAKFEDVIMTARFGKDWANSEAYKKDIESIQDAERKSGHAEGVSDDKAREEAVAYAIQDYIFNGADGVRAFEAIVNQDLNWRDKLMEALRKVVDKLKSLFNGESKAVQEAIAEFENVFKRYADAEKINKVGDTEKKAIAEANATDEVSHSLALADVLEAKSEAYHQKNATNVSAKTLVQANSDIQAMVGIMRPYLDQEMYGASVLPKEVYGKGMSTIFGNQSYGASMENTTICLRTLAYIEFVDDVKEKLGRPLTTEESFLASQMLYDIATDPQCLYCYVSLDRKAYDEMLIKYIQQRDAVIAMYDAIEGRKTKDAVEEVFQTFLGKRKDTKPMRDRFNMWIDAHKKGLPMITLADLRTAKSIEETLQNGDANIAKQIKDAKDYAQNSAQGKKIEDYRAYTGELLKISDKMYQRLNNAYGLRFYSFSEYTPAFIVENMQMMRDAALKGLRGLAYTKEVEFAKIFAPTQANINISIFGRRDANGDMVMDTRQGADWNEAQALREQYPNVGLVFVATNDADVEWALAQDFIDVVIPFHIVRTGSNIADFYEWTNYKDMQEDKGGKSILPNEHNNDKETFLRLAEERGLTPRFSKWVDNPNYMKLVNETRRASKDTPFLQPIFNLDEAKASFKAFVDKGGYFGGWYNVDEQGYQEGVEQVYQDIVAGKTAKDVDYGRQDVPADALNTKRKVRQHNNVVLRSSNSLQKQPNTQEVVSEADVVESYSISRNEKSAIEIALPEDETSFKGTAISTTDGAKILKDIDSASYSIARDGIKMLDKAASTIQKWVETDARSKSFIIDLPEWVDRKVKYALGRDVDSHRITSDSLRHILKNHGEKGNKLNPNSIPITKDDLTLIPYIMVAPDIVEKGSTLNNRESIRYVKNISNGRVLVVEKELDYSDSDMETITMWGELSDVSYANNAQDRTPETTTIGRSDSAKIRKDAETAIEKSKKFNESFSISRNNEATIDKWLGKREDFTDEVKSAFKEYIADFKPATQLATTKWFANGVIRIPEDMPKVEQAMEIAQRKKVDALQYNSPMELIEQFGVVAPKEKLINPDDVPTLSNKTQVPNTDITIYDVDDSEESRKNFRELMNSHLGKESSPWCLLQADKNGVLTKESARYWKHYNRYPKRAAFNNGKLVAFFASDGEPTWWDRMDQPHSEIPIVGKIKGDALGRTATMLYNERGEMVGYDNIHKGDKQNGLYEEWYNLEQLSKRGTFKNGRREGIFESWFPNGVRQTYVEFEDDFTGKLAEQWNENNILIRREMRNDNGLVGARAYWNNSGGWRSLTAFMTKPNGETSQGSLNWDTKGALVNLENYTDDLSDKWNFSFLKYEWRNGKERKVYDWTKKVFYSTAIGGGVETITLSNHKNIMFADGAVYNERGNAFFDANIVDLDSVIVDNYRYNITIANSFDGKNERILITRYNPVFPSDTFATIENGKVKLGQDATDAMVNEVMAEVKKRLDLVDMAVLEVQEDAKREKARAEKIREMYHADKVADIESIEDVGKRLEQISNDLASTKDSFSIDRSQYLEGIKDEEYRDWTRGKLYQIEEAVKNGLDVRLGQTISTYDKYAKKEERKTKRAKTDWDRNNAEQKVASYRAITEYGRAMMKEYFPEFIANAHADNIKSGNAPLSQIEELFNKYNKNEDTAELFKVVMKTARQIGTKARFETLRDGSRLGEQRANLIKYDVDAMNSDTISDESKATVLLHELIHAVTASGILLVEQPSLMIRTGVTPSAQLKSAVRRLKRTFDSIKKDEAFKGTYGSTSYEEMLAELANPKFAEKLKAHDIWVRVINGIREVVLAIASIVTGKDYKTSAYAELRDTLTDIIEETPMEFVGFINVVRDETIAKNYMEAESAEEIASLAESEGTTSFSLVRDEAKIAELEASPKRIGYRNVILNEDGSFSSPMATHIGNTGKGKVKSAAFNLGEWEEAEENPQLVDEKGQVVIYKDNGKPTRVAYDPYIHNRTNKVNSQFKEAWKRPNLVYVETEVPINDLESGYHADKAKLAVGTHDWAGGSGEVMLSRYDKPIRIVGWEEVADDWVERFKDTGVHFDIVPPALLPILKERGVEILPPHKGLGADATEAYEASRTEQSFSILRDEDTDTIFATAKEEFASTNDWLKTGWLMPDGTQLDFAEGGDYRGTDHRAIGAAYKGKAEHQWQYLQDFESRGGIRIHMNRDGKYGTIEMTIKPTAEQKKRLRSFIGAVGGNVDVDFMDENYNTAHSASYEGVSPARVLSGITNFYDEGIKPKGNVSYSLDRLNKRTVEKGFGGIWIADKQEFAKFASAVRTTPHEEDGEGIAFTDNYFYAYYRNIDGQPIPFASVYMNAYESQDVVNSIKDAIKNGENKTVREWVDWANESIRNIRNENDAVSGSNKGASNTRGNGGVDSKLSRKGRYFDSPELYVKTQRTDIKDYDEIDNTNYSLNRNDIDYLDAVNRGDMVTAHKMVDEAAENAGFTIRAYHGTDKGGFTVFENSQSDDRLSFFFTDNWTMASSYSKEKGDINLGDDVNTIREAKSLIEDFGYYEVQKGYTVDGEDIYDSPEDLLKDWELEEGETIKEVYNVRNTFEGYSISEGWVNEDEVIKIARTFVRDESENREQSGIYDVRLKFDNPMVIDAKGANWDSIYIGEDVKYVELNTIDSGDDIELQIGISPVDGDGIRLGGTSEVVTFASWDDLYDYVNKRFDEEVAEWVTESGSYDAMFDFKEQYVVRKSTTRDIAEDASAGGHDGVIIHNLWDNGPYAERQGVSGTVYIVFDANHIKSTNPVTYDDKGNIIPLSERFSEKDDIRYSLNRDNTTVATPELEAEANEELSKEAKLAAELEEAQNTIDRMVRKLNAVTERKEMTFDEVKAFLLDSDTMSGLQEASAGQYKRIIRNVLNVLENTPNKRIKVESLVDRIQRELLSARLNLANSNLKAVAKDFKSIITKKREGRNTRGEAIAKYVDNTTRKMMEQFIKTIEYAHSFTDENNKTTTKWENILLAGRIFTNDAIDEAMATLRESLVEEYDEVKDGLLSLLEVYKTVRDCAADVQDVYTKQVGAERDIQDIKEEIDSLQGLLDIYHSGAKGFGKALREIRGMGYNTISDAEARVKALQGTLKALRGEIHSYKQEEADSINRLVEAVKDMNTAILGVDKEGRVALKEELAKKREAMGEFKRGVFRSVRSPHYGKVSSESAKQADKLPYWQRRDMVRRGNVMFSDVTETFEFGLRRMDRMSIANEWLQDGIYYQFIMHPTDGVIARSDWRYKTEKGLRNAFEEEARKRFAPNVKEGKFKFSDLKERVKEKSGIVITTIESRINGEPVDKAKPTTIDLTVGQLLYIRAMVKQQGGINGYLTLGLKADQIEAIVKETEERYPDFCEFDDWIRGEEGILEQIYKIRNEIYRKIYGRDLDHTEGYFPIERMKGAIKKSEDVGETIDASTISSGIGSNKKRVRNSTPMNIDVDYFEKLDKHISESIQWCAGAELIEKMNALLSSSEFRNILEAQGFSKTAFKNGFKRAIGERLGGEEGKDTTAGKVLNSIGKNAVVSNIAFNLNSALKQLVSISATLSNEVSPKLWLYFIGNVMPTSDWSDYKKIVAMSSREETSADEVISLPIVRSCYEWAKENVPTFAKRADNETMGFDIFELEGVEKWDRFANKIKEWGMKPNVLMDLFTCSILTKTYYDYQYDRNIERGMTEQEAHDDARMRASVLMNQTQQSSEGAFVSAYQSDRLTGAAAFFRAGTVAYQNSQLGFDRNARSAYQNIATMLYDMYGKQGAYDKVIEYQAEQYEKRGIAKDKAMKMAKADYRRSFLTQCNVLLHNMLLNNTLWAMSGVMTMYVAQAASFVALAFLGGSGYGDEATEISFENIHKEVAKQLRNSWWVYTIPMSQSLIGKPIADLVGVASTFTSAKHPATLQPLFDTKSAIDKLFTVIEKEDDEEVKLQMGALGLVAFDTATRYGLGLSAKNALRIAGGLYGIAKDGETENFMNVLSSPRYLTKEFAGRPRKDETMDEYTERVSGLYKIIHSFSKGEDVSKLRKQYIDRMDEIMFYDTDFDYDKFKEDKKRVERLSKGLVYSATYNDKANEYRYRLKESKADKLESMSDEQSVEEAKLAEIKANVNYIDKFLKANIGWDTDMAEERELLFRAEQEHIMDFLNEYANYKNIK